MGVKMGLQLSICNRQLGGAHKNILQDGQWGDVNKTKTKAARDSDLAPN